MKLYRIASVFLTILLIATCSLNAQILREADNLFRDCQYEKSLEAYKKGIKKLSSNRVEIQRATFRIAECYRIMGDLKKAEQQYLRLEKKNYQKDNPIILYHLGNIYNLRGDYDQALAYYNKYKKRAADDARADTAIAGCQNAKMWLENPTRYEVENLKKFNTREDEWAPRWGNNEKRNSIIFTSNREGSAGKGTDQWTGVSFSDIYVSNKPKSKNTDWPGEWSPVKSYDQGGVLNSDVNEGEASCNRKGTVLYFTKCPQDKKKVQGCYIYKSLKKGNSWGEPELVFLGDSAYNYVHPFISDDELTIYFASNMPGGEGGYDIYKATRAKKSAKFSNITNLGKNVNTAGQEVFPCMRNEEEFYFSSDGHPGMGGLDIFLSRIDKNGNFGPAENMMSPINSSGDDIGIMFDENEAIDPQSQSPYMAKGYFSSNRSGGKGGDDIYYFLLRPIVYTLSGKIRDKNNGQYMDAVDVEIVGSDGTSYKTTTDVKGYYHFDKAKILGATTYDIKVAKKGYWESGNTAKITTIGIMENTDFTQDFVLEPIPKEPILLPEILYDLAKWDLKPQYQDSLMYLYNIMVKNPTIVIELRSHTDSRDTEEKNDVLSQNRAQSCVDFLISKGIAADRIVPKGYGERVPRRLEKDMYSNYNGKRYFFPKGTYLTEEFCESQPTKNEKEAAHALNRRTEFLILRDDYVPHDDSVGTASGTSTIAVIQQRTVPVTINGEDVLGTCFANSKSMNFLIGNNSDEIFMNYADATRFLKESIIKVNDFEDKAGAIKQEDGSIIENSVLYLEELRVGDDYEENVKVTVKKGLAAPFVIGSGFIEENWGSYTIDKEKNLLKFNK
ncbi:MAG: OmpA family protein [Bacteroidales bacterium]|jgi:peptidoglycan-associated lipoprotein|nr:OmpA family protein [Bacteroidales bacterium]